MKSEAMKKLAAGEKAAIRFRAPKKAYTLNDRVKGSVT
jgi:glutamyl/glutaminyl-tRNA synthetase